MGFPIQHRQLPCVITLAAALCGSAAAAQTVDVSRAQTAMVTIRIGEMPQMHTVPVVAYEALIRQGIKTTVVNNHANQTAPSNLPVYLENPAPSAANGADPLTTPTWTVGVFR